MSLSKEEKERYVKQMRINGWGLDGQMRVKRSSVAVVGIGGLGCLSSLYLAAAGVGRLVLIDRERFELSNLNRQVLCQHRDIGRPKVEVAKERIESFNPNVEVDAVFLDLNEDNIGCLLKGVNLILDGLDNWATRFLVNKYCVKRRIPFVHAGVSGMQGQVTTIIPGEGPCLRCIFPVSPREKGEVPVVGATPALLASIQVLEAVKILTGVGDILKGKILFIDGEDMSVQEVIVERDDRCPVCGRL